MKKKALAMLLALVMVIGLVPFSAFAAEEPMAKFTLTTTAGENLEVGDTFTVTATLDKNPGYTSFAMDLDWNPNVVEFKGFVTTEDDEYVLKDTILSDSAVFNNENGYVTEGRMRVSTKTGTLFIANFEVVGTGDCGIRLNEEETLFYDAENNITITRAINTEAIDKLSVPAATEDPDVPVEPEGPSVTETGYTVSASEDKTVAVGENAVVNIYVNSDKVSTFNAYELTLTYDEDKLDFFGGTSFAEDEITVDADEKNGTIHIVGYGEAKNFDLPAVKMIFVKTAASDAEVKITSAKVDIDANANLQNAPEADIIDDTTVIYTSAYTVTLGEGLRGAGTVAPGADYTFEATDADNYNYTITATMGGKNVDVEVNEDGSYTIENVTGNLEISATMTPKSYNVTINGEDTTGAETATYNTPYTFNVDEKDGFNYEVAVTIGGKAYTGYTVEGGTYTIPGADITGDIVINVTKTAIPATEHAVKFEGNGATDAQGAPSVKDSEDYTFTVNKEDGYDYEVTAKMGDAAVVVTEANGTYTIANVTGNLVITVNKAAQEPAGPTVAVSEYIKLNEQSMWLVTVAGVKEGEVAKYDGMSMYWSDKYDAYAWLVISADSQEDVEAAAAAAVTTAAGEAADTVAYTGDVNCTDLVDVNDAQLTYDMYNGKYTLEDVAMLKFLNADVTADKTVNVQDAAAIVAIIVG